MTLPLKLQGYADCVAQMDRALESPNGIAIRFTVHGAAVRFRQRCYQLRKLLRELSTEQYIQGESGWGRCAYDPIVITLEEYDEESWELIYKVQSSELEVREL